MILKLLYNRQINNNKINKLNKINNNKINNLNKINKKISKLFRIFSKTFTK